MVELKNVDQAASGGGDCPQGDDAAQETSRKVATVADLNEDQLDGIFSEEDPHKQFEVFARCLGLPRPESMSTLSRIAAEYDYLNVMFCREQNFTAEQTIAFRGITQTVFEAGIVRGELDVNEAFQEFTERVLALAGETDTTPQENNSPVNKPPATALTPGVSANGDGGGGGNGEGAGGRGAPATVTRSTSGNPPKNTGSSKAKELVVDPTKAAGKGDASILSGGGNSGGGETGDGVSSSGGGGGGGSGTGSGGGGGVEAGPVFSVGDVAAITLFVARGLYRHFALYRMCFEQQAKYCTEVRDVQVETPLEPPPLHEAEFMA